MDIQFNEHKSNYTFIRFTQKCFLDPTKRFYSQVKKIKSTYESLWLLFNHKYAGSVKTW